MLRAVSKFAQRGLGCVRGRRAFGARCASTGALTGQHSISEDLVKTQAFIDGVFADSQSKTTFPVLDPATGEALALVADCGVADADAAIAAADAAFGQWSKTLAKERSTILRRWSELMLEHSEDLAKLMTLECGKPLAESRGEVAYAASFFEWFAEEARRSNGSIMPHNAPGRRLLTIRQPVGVAAAITPWNFPAAMLTRKVGPVRLFPGASLSLLSPRVWLCLVERIRVHHGCLTALRLLALPSSPPLSPTPPPLSSPTPPPSLQ